MAPLGTLIAADLLATRVGPAVAKLLLKLWLRDSSVATDTATDLVDLFSPTVANVFAKKSGARQLEEIGERIAESLEPVFNDFTFTKDVQAGVVAEVAQTLENAHLSADILAQEDVDAGRLSAYLKATRPNAVRSHSSPFQALYGRLIDEVAKYIVNIASRLPGFTENTLSEILRRERTLVETAAHVLREIEVIKEESRRANSNERAAWFEEEYRLGTANKLDRLELFGVHVTGPNRSHRLSVAYVSLSVVEDVRGSQHSYSPSEVVINAESQGVHQALLASPRLVLRGQAGSGKTTLLKWVAVNCTRRTFEASLEPWNELLPFFIPLRACTEGPFPRPEQFPSLLLPSIAGEMPDGWVHQHLRSGRGILLIDGVDEVPSHRRYELTEWLREVASTFPLARMVVTSRPSAVSEEWLRAEKFTDLELQPMDLTDIEVFLEHWHAAVREELQYDEEKEKLIPLQKNLWRLIRENKAVRELATSPLLCAAICALNRERNEQVPSDRIELYEACCHMLLEGREKEQRLAVRSEYPALTFRQSMFFLEDVAYWMLRNGWSLAEKDTIAERISRHLPRVDLPSGMDSKRILAYFVDRSGLVREPAAGRIDFTHRTFQEYLAARAIVAEGDVGVLRDKADDDQWAEVIALAAGVAAGTFRDNLLRELIARGDAEPGKRHQIHLLAVACLETAVDIDPQVRKAILHRLEAVVPPRSITEAKAVASAGDLAVPFLKSHRRFKSQEAAASVRALSIIGSESSLVALRSYRRESRETVRRELIKAYSAHPSVEYVNEVLRDLQLQSVALDRISTLEGFGVLQSLRSLSITRSPRLKDLSPIAGLTGLISLFVQDCSELESVEPVGALARLQRLSILFSPNVSNLSPVSQCKELRRLILWVSDRIQSLKDLSGLPKLEELSIYNGRALTDISAILSFPRLRSMALHIAGGLRDFSIFSRSSIQQLTLSNVSVATDIGERVDVDTFNNAALKNLTLTGIHGVQNWGQVAVSSLQSLHVTSSTRIENIGALAACAGLKRLTLRLVTLDSLQGVDRLGALAALHCQSIKVEDGLWTPLGEVPNLDSLSFVGIRDLDLSFINAIQTLQILRIEHCNVRGSESIWASPALKEVHVSGFNTSLQIPSNTAIKVYLNGVRVNR